MYELTIDQFVYMADNRADLIETWTKEYFYHVGSPFSVYNTKKKKTIFKGPHIDPNSTKELIDILVKEETEEHAR